jgi:hypothetical protein
MSTEFNARRPSRKDGHWCSFARVGPVLLVLFALVSFSASADAATVKALQGQVLVNGGQGYRLVDGSTQLGPGATVVANPGAVAQVVYAGGCAVTVQAGSVYVIAAQAPCENGQPTKTGGLTEKTEGPSATSWALGAAAVGAGGAGIYFLIKSASP